MRKPLIIAAALSAFTLAACGDSNSPGADPNIGTWIGTYGSGAATGPNDYTFIFFAGDSVHIIDGLPPFDPATGARGTWSRAGTTITTAYTYAGGGSFSTTGTLNASTGAAGTILTGTWGATPSTTDGGGFTITKQ